VNVTDYPILSIIVFLPLIGVPLIALLPEKNKTVVAFIATLSALATFLVSLLLFVSFKSDITGYQFMENHSWIPSFGISYLMGVDGISLLLIILTTFLTLIAIISTYTAVDGRFREYMITILVLEAGMNGIFASLDLFLFYVFWEIILIPMVLMIGIWGGKNRLYASIKFFLYTLAGSTLMLIAIIYMAFQLKLQTGSMSFSLIDLQALLIAPDIQLYLFIAFTIAFAVKVPYFPFHTWLPDAHTEAPTAGSVILAGVLLKMGTYGFLRFILPLFPEASISMAPFMSLLAVVGIVYGAFMAIVQTDVKRLVAYSSVSHLGFVMLGIFALNEEGLTGGIMQSLNHGISTGMLFLLVGMIYERRHTRLISEYGGIASVMPVFAIYMMIATLSSVALPGTNGFVGEFMILTGAFLASHTLGIIAASGVILGAVYMLWMYQRVFLGKITVEANKTLKDLNFREHFILIPLVVLIFFMGIMPSYTTRYFQNDVKKMVSFYDSKSPEKIAVTESEKEMNPEAIEKTDVLNHE